MFEMGTGVTPPPLPPETFEGKGALRALIPHFVKAKNDQASRPISTGQLSTLQCVHTRPINLVVYEGSLGACARDT